MADSTFNTVANALSSSSGTAPSTLANGVITPGTGAITYTNNTSTGSSGASTVNPAVVSDPLNNLQFISNLYDHTMTSGLVHTVVFKSLVAGSGITLTPGSNATLVITSSGSGSGGVSSFISLSDVPNSYAGSTGRYVAVNTAGNGLEFVIPPAVGATSFGQLDDVPTNFGTPGQTLVVNSSSSGLVYATPTSGITSFVGLSDVPNSYSGSANKILAVNGAGTGVVFITAPIGGVSAFSQLSDVPQSYAGQTGKFLAVNSTSNGVAFVPAPTVTIPSNIPVAHSVTINFDGGGIITAPTNLPAGWSVSNLDTANGNVTLTHNVGKAPFTCSAIGADSDINSNPIQHAQAMSTGFYFTYPTGSINSVTVITQNNGLNLGTKSSNSSAVVTFLF